MFKPARLVHSSPVHLCKGHAEVLCASALGLWSLLALWPFSRSKKTGFFLPPRKSVKEMLLTQLPLLSERNGDSFCASEMQIRVMKGQRKQGKLTKIIQEQDDVHVPENRFGSGLTIKEFAKTFVWLFALDPGLQRWKSPSTFDLRLAKRRSDPDDLPRRRAQPALRTDLSLRLPLPPNLDAGISDTADLLWLLCRMGSAPLTRHPLALVWFNPAERLEHFCLGFEGN